jgi:hypothetical protein
VGPEIPSFAQGKGPFSPAWLDRINAGGITTIGEQWLMIQLWRLRSGAIALGFCVLLGACDGRNTDQKSNKDSEEIDKETALMADAERAGPELERRLQADVSAADGLVFVNYFNVQLFILPATTPWVIRCGSGLSITFGSSVTGSVEKGAGDVENEIVIYLTPSPIDQKHCSVLGRLVGKRLQAILRQDQAIR